MESNINFRNYLILIIKSTEFREPCPINTKMSCNLRKKLLIFSDSKKSQLFRLFSQATEAASFKFSTGLTGLKVDPLARKNLLKQYTNLETKLKQLPADYGYRIEMLNLLEERNNLIKNESLSDFDLEMKIGEGQLEELIEQAEEEHKLIEKLSNEWKPWE